VKRVKLTTATRKERTTMGRKRRTGPEAALDKTVGTLGEVAGRGTGDKSLEAEGRAMRRKGKMKTYLVRPHAEKKKGWKVEAEGAKRASSVHRTKAEAVAAAKEMARGRAPSQVLVYKKDGLNVQEEKTYW
jgi:uncharacterized protein YjbJ (UPF0337 family)